MAHNKRLEAELLVIGSGLTADAFVSGLMAKNAARKVFVLGGIDFGNFRHLSTTFSQGKPIVTHSSFIGGLGRSWHSLIPKTYIHKSKESKALFKLWYGNISSESDECDRYFAPFFPHRPLIAKRAYHNVTFLADTASHIRKDKVVVTHCGIKIDFRKAVLACGTVPALQLLSRSGYLDSAVFLSDHVNIFLGNVNKPFVSDVEYERPIGFTKKYEKRGEDVMLIRRPAWNLNKYGVRSYSEVYSGKSQLEIISKILSLKSFRLVAEALHNKFGLFRTAPYTALYAQVLVENMLSFDRYGVRISDERVSDKLVSVHKTLQDLEILKNNFMDFYGGIHCALNESIRLPEYLIPLGGLAIPLKDCLHNSFSNCSDAFLKGLSFDA